MLNVVLVEPEIPANTGNIGRTCVLTGTRLHLVGPMGFELTDKAVQRAGLAYWDSLDLRVYDSWDTFCARNHLLETPGAMHLLTKVGARTYAETSYHDGDWLVFGKESAGLSRELLAAHPDRCERIPMLGDDALANAEPWHESFGRQHPELRRDICGNFVDERAGQITSLNLSNAVAVVVYEALRQRGFPGMGGGGGGGGGAKGDSPFWLTPFAKMGQSPFGCQGGLSPMAHLVRLWGLSPLAAHPQPPTR